MHATKGCIAARLHLYIALVERLGSSTGLSEQPETQTHKGVGLRDIAAGLFILAIGIAVGIAALELNFGTPQRMGSGFLPFWLGILMGLAGILIIVGGLRGGAAFPEFPTIRPLAALICGFAAFALLVGPAGLILAAFSGVLISSFGMKQPHLIQSVIFAAILAGASALLFVVLLEVPINIWPRN